MVVFYITQKMLSSAQTEQTEPRRSPLDFLKLSLNLHLFLQTFNEKVICIPKYNFQISERWQSNGETASDKMQEGVSILIVLAVENLFQMPSPIA